MKNCTLLSLTFCLLCAPALAAGNRTLRFAPYVNPLTPVAAVNVSPPEIVGLDTVGSTLRIRPGVWTGTSLTFTYSWHYVGGASLGTGTTYGPLVSGELGKAIQLDETATNGLGSVTKRSYWVGPVESSTPAFPFAYETCLIGATGDFSGLRRS